MIFRRLLVTVCLVTIAPGCIFGGGPPPPFEDSSDDGTTPASDAASNVHTEDAGVDDASANNEPVPDQGADQGPGDDVDMSTPDLDPDLCGDGQLNEGEACDPGIADVEAGGCPMTADDCPVDGCGMARIVGLADDCSAECVVDTENTACGEADDCCPDGCGSDDDPDCVEMCGNGVVEGDEFCDGNCPESPSDCDDGESCTADRIVGDASTCDALCSSTTVTNCVDDDGCCPDTCTSEIDNDCSASCGDGIVDQGETCDGDCPTSCDDGDSCTYDELSGSADNCTAECVNTDIVSCVDDDGCCPDGCNANDDSDCSPVCGNDVTEDGETCDGNCPADCVDADVCTEDVQTGDPSTCDIVCTNDDITACSLTSDGCCPPGCNANNDADCMPVCGNDVTEDGELCDGNCPASCNDNDICTTDTLTGDAATCDAMCDNTTITACVDGDGCCPGACDSTNDSDCNAVCGNGIVESGETCDGNCPTSCAGVCETLSGSASNCDVQCVTDPNCTPCDRDGSCPCADGEECNGGKCVSSTGDGCTNACDEDAFCAVHGGSGWVCDDGDDFCKECLIDGDCLPHEICATNTCIVPNSCDQAPDGDAWCENDQGPGWACDGTECKKLCPNGDSDCINYETCSGGFCEIPADCTGASEPNSWCEKFTSGDSCMANGTCTRTCDPDACAVDCGVRGCEKTQLAGGNIEYVCVDVDDCYQSCKIHGWCVDDTTVQTAKCSINSDGNASICINWKGCPTGQDSACSPIEQCDTSSGLPYTCVKPSYCYLASQPDSYCTWDYGSGYTCGTRGGCEP